MYFTLRQTTPALPTAQTVVDNDTGVVPAVDAHDLVVPSL
jgi:hypothetical protein